MKNKNGKKDKREENDNTFQIILFGISPYTKYNTNLGYKTIYNYVISYVNTTIIIGFEVFEKPENTQINLWPKHNLITLDKIMINVWNKKIIDLGYKKD